MWCSDPFQNELRKKGYCVVALPRSNIEPLTLIQLVDGRFEDLGPVTDVLIPESGATVPLVQRGGIVADLGTVRTGSMRIGLGLAVLARVIRSLGGDPEKLKAAYGNTRSLTLELHDIKVDHVDVTSVEKYLVACDLDPASRHTTRLLNVGAIYLIVSTLKSSSLDVEAESRQSSELAVSASGLTAAGIDGQATITSEGRGKTRVRYEGADQLVFAFKAIQLSYRDGQFTRFTVGKPGAGTLGHTTQHAMDDYSGSAHLLPEAPFIELQ